MAESLKEGDVVELKSGGPAMTIEAITEIGADCSWFEGTKHFTKTFKLVALKPYEEPRYV